MSFLLRLAESLPRTSLVLSLLGLVLLIVVLILMRRARRAASRMEEAVALAVEDGKDVQTVDLRAPTAEPGLREAFKDALAKLRAHTSGRDYRYGIPWMLQLGPAGSGGGRLMAKSGLNLPLGRAAQALAEAEDGAEGEALETPLREGVRWWLFDRGVVLDLAGDLILPRGGRKADEPGWQTLLELLNTHRAKRPIDGILLNVALSDLVEGVSGGSGRARLAEMGSQLYRRLWNLQKALGMRLPVYVVVTGAEELPGFGATLASLPQHLKDQMLGWSNPYGLETAFQGGWVDEAFETMHRELVDVQMERFAEAPPVPSADPAFAFPGALGQLRGPVRVLLEEVFRQTAYHESFFLRGIYIVGEEAPAEAAGVTEAGADGAGVASGPTRSAVDPTEFGLETWSPPPAVPAAPFEGVGPSGLGATTQALEAGAGRRVGLGGTPRFLRQLLEEKVFPEWTLALPTGRGWRASNRRILAAQILLAALVVTWATGLWFASRRLDRRAVLLSSVLDEISWDVRTERRNHEEGVYAAGGGTPAGLGRRAGDAISAETLRLFSRMGELDGTLHSAFIPWSWSSPVHEQVVSTIETCFRYLVMKPLAVGLRDRATEVLSRPYEPSRYAPPVFGAESTPEFFELGRYLDELGELDSNLHRFNGLQSFHQDQTEDLGQLVGYVARVEIPKDFLSGSEYYRLALARVRGELLDYHLYQDPAQGRFRRIARGFHDRLFDKNMLRLEAEALRQAVFEAESQAWDPVVRSQSFAAVSERIAEIQRLVTLPELEWVRRPSLDLGPSHDGLMARVGASRFLGPSVRQEIEGQGQARFRQLQEILLGLQTDLTGPILAQASGLESLGLSAEARDLGEALGGLLRQDFVGGVYISSLEIEPPVRDRSLRLRWRQGLFEEALAFIPPFESFVAQDLAGYPEALQVDLEEAARDQLGARIEGVLSAGQEWIPVEVGSTNQLLEMEIAAAVDDFQAVADPLGRLISELDRLSLASLSRRLADLKAREGKRILGRLELLLGRSRLYEPLDGGFGWWDGEQAPPWAAFGARDESELASYLGVQRDQVEKLASVYAQPVLAFFDRDLRWRDNELALQVTRWRAVMTALERRESQDPSSPVVALERFVGETLPAVRMDNCLALLAPLAAGTGGDFFRERQDDLRKGLRDRCQALAFWHGGQVYQELSQHFNRRLAGRYPFSSREAGPDRNALARQADPEAVRQFYSLFDQSGTLLRQVPRELLGIEASAFLDRMAQARGFFTEFLDGAGEDAPPLELPVFDLEVDFRVNRERERGGEHILDWSLTVGEQRLRRQGTERKARWIWGTPLRLSLAWAADGQVVPVDRPGVSATVEERRVTWDYAGDWSLLRLLETHAAQPDDFDRLQDPSPHTLRLVVPVRRTDVGAAGQSEALVFLRIGLLTPQGQESIQRPTFPAKAPALSSQLAGLLDEPP